MLNGVTSRIQIHGYIARKYDFECAKETKKFWRSVAEIAFSCHECETCGCVISGLVNRLDCETSGVLVVTKTAATFIDLRKRIGRKNDTTRKRYLSLVHSAVSGDDWRPAEGYCKWDITRSRTKVPTSFLSGRMP